MPESEHHTATLPVPVPDIPSYTADPAPDNPAVQNNPGNDAEHIESDNGESPHTEASSKKIPVSLILKKTAITLLCGITVLVFAVTGVYAVRKSSIGSHFFTRLMLGEFFGGIGNVQVVSTSEAGYRNVQPGSTTDMPELHPLEGIKSPDAELPKTEHRTLSAAGLALSNETPYDPDLNEILAMDRVIPPLSGLYAEYGEDAPVVLILHTHGTEAFAECASAGYRSTDITKNIVSAGTVIADTLEENGVSTIHCTTMFDEEDFTMAYYNASLEIRRLLEEHPSISYILDVHRDSIETDGIYIAPSTTSENSTAAQMMFVIGTDYGGSGHTTWRNNLSLAARLHTALNEKTPQLMRDINLRSASFNEQYSDGSLLLEVGACASSLAEVHHSAKLFADALADEIIGNQ